MTSITAMKSYREGVYWGEFSEPVPWQETCVLSLRDIWALVWVWMELRVKKASEANTKWPKLCKNLTTGARKEVRPQTTEGSDV